MTNWQAVQLAALTEDLERFTAAVEDGDQEATRRGMVRLWERVREAERETGRPHPLRPDLARWESELLP